MAIAGGAVVPLVMGAVNDSFGITGAMVVPFLACLYILFPGLRSMRETTARA
jgi:fucose permease